MEIVEINPNRIYHQLALYGMTEDELLTRASGKLKTPLTKEEIFSSHIRLSHLKKIDEVFRKGLSYFIDPADPEKSRSESIFFRKENFNVELNFGAKQIVSKFEQEKLEFLTLSKLADFKFERVLKTYFVSSDPRNVAKEIRNQYSLRTAEKPRDFLKSLIEKNAEFNILVFEFVETWNKREKANIDGMFLSPNVIVLKRNQTSFRREIFTLLHELGHYLLNIEEIDNIWESDFGWNSISRVERWCSDFAFYFLLGDLFEVFRDLPEASQSNNFNTEAIEFLRSRTFLSSLALYTRLAIEKRITSEDYNRIKSEILKSIEKRENEEKERARREKELALARGEKPRGSTPKPIMSPLYREALISAMYMGLLNEFQVCKKLGIKPERLEALAR